MKKIIFSIALTIAALCANSQKLGQYAAVSYSVGNGAYDATGVTSYATVEYGLTKDAFSFGVAFGASEITENAKAYIEPKASVTVAEYKNVRAFFMSGVGVILNDEKTFLIEYGGGVLTPVFKNTDFCLQYSNWSGVNYVSVGLCTNF